MHTRSNSQHRRKRRNGRETRVATAVGVWCLREHIVAQILQLKVVNCTHATEARVVGGGEGGGGGGGDAGE